MAEDSRYGPRQLDLGRPNAARLYDFFLGGAHSTAEDRVFAEQFNRIAPRWVAGARLNRSFLRRAVIYLAAERGIDQFLDLGSGIPTVGNVHEVAQQVNPDAHVVYVDYEPVAYNVAQAILADEPNTAVVHADLRQPAVVLNHPETRRLLDFSRPIALLLIGVTLFISPDDHPAELITNYREHLVPGSGLAVSQVTTDAVPADLGAEIDRVVAAYQRANEQITLRGHDEVLSWFTGTELVEPGLVRLPDWRPNGQVLSEDEQGARMQGYGAVGMVV